MSKIGIQLYSVRDKTKDNFLDTIREIGSLGYDGVQFAGFFDTPAKELKRTMDEAGVVAAGSHMPYHQLLGDNLNDTLAYNDTIGNDLIVCPSLPEDLKGSVDAFKRATNSLNEIGRKCVEQGFRFGYHNHNFEFHRLEDANYGFSILFNETDPENVKMELDCYWALHGGFDPVKIITEHKNRCVSLHLKDMKHNENGEKVSTEIGEGELDITSVLNIANQTNVEWLTIEQEDFDKDTLESAKINVINLKKLMG